MAEAVYLTPGPSPLAERGGKLDLDGFGAGLRLKRIREAADCVRSVVALAREPLAERGGKLDLDGFGAGLKPPRYANVRRTRRQAPLGLMRVSFRELPTC